jgi:hypothetical protein
MYAAYYLNTPEPITSEELCKSIPNIVNLDVCWLPNSMSNTRLWANVPAMMHIPLCRCRRRTVMTRVVDFIREICDIAPLDTETLCQRIQTEVLRDDDSDTIAALVACSIYYGNSHTLAYMLLGSSEHSQTSAYTILESTIDTGDIRACRFLLSLHSDTITLPSSAECSTYIKTAVSDYRVHRERPSDPRTHGPTDPRTRDAYVRILSILWYMASSFNLFLLLNSASRQRHATTADLNEVDGDELIHLVFRVLALLDILIPQETAGYNRNYVSNLAQEHIVPVDHPDTYYTRDPGVDKSYPPNPRGYFRDMLEYACWQKEAESTQTSAYDSTNTIRGWYTPILARQ